MDDRPAFFNAFSNVWETFQNPASQDKRLRRWASTAMKTLMRFHLLCLSGGYALHIRMEIIETAAGQAKSAQARRLTSSHICRLWERSHLGTLAAINH